MTVSIVARRRCHSSRARPQSGAARSPSRTSRSAPGGASPSAATTRSTAGTSPAIELPQRSQRELRGIRGCPERVGGFLSVSKLHVIQRGQALDFEEIPEGIPDIRRDFLSSLPGVDLLELLVAQVIPVRGAEGHAQNADPGIEL